MAGDGNRGKGRPKGSLNRSRDEVRAIIESVIPLREQVELLAKLSRGVLVQDGEGKEVYSEPPNVKALTVLLEQSAGKAPQSVDITSQGNGIFDALKFTVVSKNGTNGHAKEHAEHSSN